MNRSASRTVLLVAPGALLACTTAVTVAAQAFPEACSPARPTWPHAPTVLGWARFDAGWYAWIAQHGSSYTPGQQSPVAFFPAYPMALRGLGALGLDTFLAGVLLTMVCGVLALYFFTRWARTRADEEAVRHAGLLAKEGQGPCWADAVG